MEGHPAWWRYEIAISPHAFDRMDERGLDEMDLRLMLELAVHYRPAVVPGRFVIETGIQRERWEIVVEPDGSKELLIVVTTYRIQ